MRARRANGKHVLTDARVYPTWERGQHDKLETLPHAITGDEDRPSQPFRAVDALVICGIMT